ncbi:MAG: hypothetical protein FWC03_08245 [Treponema sp.]|nr:hypothetical protein [Treponema sp.]
MENTQTQIDYPRGLTFEHVWAALMEDREQIKESRKEFDQQMKESRMEFDQQMKKTNLQLEETDRHLKEIGKRFGDFTNRFGEVVEYMIAPNLQEKFCEMGFDFQEVSTNHKANDKKNNIHFQIDVYLQNGDTAMLVEIKTKLTISDINEHIKRLEKMRMYADFRGDKRHFLGAVAGVIVEADEREYALSSGFYLIEPSGETFNITPPYNKPKEW